MERLEPVELLQDRISEAALDPTQWSGVIADIGAAVGGHSGVLYEYEFKHRASRGIGQHRIDLDLMLEYEQYFGAIDPWNAKVMNWPVCCAAPTTALMSDRELKRTEFYNDFLRRTEIFYGLGGVVDRTRSHLAVFGIQRPGNAEPFAESDTRLIGQLMPHLRRALRIRRAFTGLAEHRAMLEETLHLMPRPVLIVDGEGHVVFANAAAQRLLDDGDGLKLRSGSLTTAHRGDQAAFAAALRAIARREISSKAVTLHRPGRRPPVMLLALALRRRSRVDGADRIALMIDADMAPPQPLEQMGALFRLTPAETRLWSALSTGLTLAEIAGRNAVSVNTLRVQLASIYRKTGAHRQADLVRMALAFRSLPQGLDS